MADNTNITEGAGRIIRTDELAGAVHVQVVKIAHGADGVEDGLVDNASPLPVVQTGALPAGDNNIGNVDLASAIPAGTNNIGDVDILSIAAGDNNIGNVDIASALPAGDNNIGNVDIVTLPALPAGDNNIGNVDLASSIPAGTNNIGDVDVLTLPALPAGNNNIGDVDIASIAAGDNNIGNVDVVTLPALPAGTNNIGDVDVLTLPALPAGTNNIGDVDVLSIVPLTGATNLGKAVDSGIGATDTGVAALVVRDDALTTLTPADADYVQMRVNARGALWNTNDPEVLTKAVTCTTSITRPANTTAYASGDALSDSTSAPTSGGFTFTSVGAASGQTVKLTDLIVSSSNPAATPLNGDLIIFDTSVTNINDNSAFAISDAEAQTVVAVVPFSLALSANNCFVHVQNINAICTPSGSANLRFLVRVTNAYTPASAEVITFRAKFERMY